MSTSEDGMATQLTDAQMVKILERLKIRHTPNGETWVLLLAPKDVDDFKAVIAALKSRASQSEDRNA